MHTTLIGSGLNCNISAAETKISCWLLVSREEVMQENAHNVARLNDYRGKHKEIGCYSPKKTLKTFHIASKIPTGFRRAHFFQAFRLF